jgi:hypothetical protein
MRFWDKLFKRSDPLDRLKRQNSEEARKLFEGRNNTEPYSIFEDPRLAATSATLRRMAKAQQKSVTGDETFSAPQGPRPSYALFLLIVLYRMFESVNAGPPSEPNEMWESARLNSLAVLTPMFGQAEANAHVSRFEQSRQLLCEAAPSGHHSAYLYWVTAIKQIAIEEAIRKRGLSLKHPPLVYSFPNGTVNALTFLIPGTTESLVLFEGGLQPFTNQLSKIMVNTFFSLLKANQQGMASGNLPPVHKLKETILRDESSFEKFQNLLLAYLFLGNPIAGGFFTIGGPEAAMAGEIEESMKLFAMGHEYGHILDTHVDYTDDGPFVAGSQSWRIAKRSLAQEYDADAHGLRLMVEAMRGFRSDKVLSLTGPDILLCCMSIVERALSIVKDGHDSEKDSGGHPSLTKRRDHLRKLIQSEFPHSAIAIAMTVTFDMILNTFFDRVKPLLFEYHKKKKPLANRWTSNILLFS